jgi:hypothetical protein
MDTIANTIGTLRETSLHAALKDWYARPGDEVEASVEGLHIDLRRGNQLIEIQTRNFAALKPKLVRLKRDGATPVSRRKSPRRGNLESLFVQWVSFPELVAHPNFSLEVLMTQEEEMLRPVGRGGDARAGGSATGDCWMSSSRWCSRHRRTSAGSCRTRFPSRSPAAS